MRVAVIRVLAVPSTHLTALVPVSLVLAMRVAVMQVIGMLAVTHCRVAAVGAVRMRVIFMARVRSWLGHGREGFLSFLSVSDSVVDDMCDVLVLQRVDDLLTTATGGDQARNTQHAQVLGDERL